MVLTGFALVVENHRDSCFCIIGFPLGQTFRVRVAGLDECEPNAADDFLELIGLRCGA